MSSRTRFGLLATIGLSLIGSAALAQVKKDVLNYAAQLNAKGKVQRIVFIASKEDHGARGNHEFFAGSLLFARLINEKYPNAYAVVYSLDNWPGTKELEKADAIIVMLNHGGRAAEDPNIKAAIARGAGFAAIHFGVEVNKGAQGENYLNWMGGYFETFWSVNPWWTPAPTLGDHPIMRGVKPFTVRDEWYYHMRFREPMTSVTPLLSAKPPAETITSRDTPSERGGNPDVIKAVDAGAPQHLAWAYTRPGGGRGFGFTGFHDYYNLLNDDFRKTLINGIVWTCGLNVPRDGVASPTPTREQLDALMKEAHTPAGSK